MDIQAGRDVGIDFLEKVQKFDGSVPLVAFADDKVRGTVERCKQRGGLRPDIGVGLPFGAARQHRQDRLLPAKVLDLTLFVNTSGQRLGGRC